ncbi:unnamed protein product [Ectocarpus sp. 6 AP-2014]
MARGGAWVSRIWICLEVGTCPGKELKPTCHFAVGARGVLCSYQAVSHSTFG